MRFADGCLECSDCPRVSGVALKAAFIRHNGNRLGVLEIAWLARCNGGPARRLPRVLMHEHVRTDEIRLHIGRSNIKVRRRPLQVLDFLSDYLLRMG